MAVGPVEQVVDLETEVAGGEPHEGVLVDLVLAAGVRAALGAAAAWRVTSRPRYSVSNAALAAGEALAHLVDDGDLLWSRDLHRTSSRFVRRSGLGVPSTARDTTPSESSEVSASSGGPGERPFQRDRAPEVFGEQTRL